MNRSRFLTGIAATTLALTTLGALLSTVPTPAAAQAEQKERKAQYQVAARTEFATVAADSEAVGKALKANDVISAGKLVRKEGAFEGKVVDVFAPESNGLLILNFDDDYKSALSAVLYSARFSKFPDMEKLKGKRVLISGTFSEYKGRPQIELKEPSQVRIIK